MSDPILSKLREILLSEFTEAELVELCKQLGLHYDALPGTGTFGKTRAIIEAARAQGKLRLLQIKLRELRPVAYAAIDLPLPEAPAVEPRRSRQRSGPPSAQRGVAPLAAVLVLIASALLLLAALMPRQSAAPAASETLTPLPSPTTSLPTQPAAEVTLEPPAEPTATPSPTLPIVVVPPSPTPDPLPAAPEATLPESLPSPETLHPAVQTVIDANKALVDFFTGRKDAAALQLFWSPSALEALVNFATNRLPRAMRVGADQRDAIRVSYEYLSPPVLADQRNALVLVTSREYWRFSTTVNDVVICETRAYRYTLAVEGDGYRIQSYSSRLLSTRCR